MHFMTIVSGFAGPGAVAVCWIRRPDRTMADTKNTANRPKSAFQAGAARCISSPSAQPADTLREDQQSQPRGLDTLRLVSWSLTPQRAGSRMGLCLVR